MRDILSLASSTLLEAPGVPAPLAEALRQARLSGWGDPALQRAEWLDPLVPQLEPALRDRSVNPFARAAAEMQQQTALLARTARAPKTGPDELWAATSGLERALNLYPMYFSPEADPEAPMDLPRLRQEYASARRRLQAALPAAVEEFAGPVQSELETAIAPARERGGAFSASRPEPLPELPSIALPDDHPQVARWKLAQEFAAMLAITTERENIPGYVEIIGEQARASGSARLRRFAAETFLSELGRRWDELRAEDRELLLSEALSLAWRSGPRAVLFVAERLSALQKGRPLWDLFYGALRDYDVGPELSAALMRATAGALELPPHTRIAP